MLRSAIRSEEEVPVIVSLVFLEEPEVPGALGGVKGRLPAMVDGIADGLTRGGRGGLLPLLR